MNFKLQMLFVFLFFANNVLCETESEIVETSYTTSVAAMEELLTSEKNLINALDKFTQELEAKLGALKNLLNQLKVENDKAIASPQEYLYNPLNCYSLIRRMHYDWQRIEVYMTKPVGKSHLKQIQAHLPKMPSSNDFSDACEAVYRLQHTYDLKAEDLAQGILNGKQYGTKLRAIDCFNMALHLYSKKEYNEAELWIKETLKRYNESDYERIINFRGENILTLNNKISLKENIGENSVNSTSEETQAIYDELFELYKLGCRGAFPQLPSRLHCNYNFTTSPFLRLAPLKMEIIHLDPYIVLYHDVIYDSEIKELQEMSLSRLERATVYNEETGESENFSGRISQFSWFKKNETNTTKRLNRRVKDMTGLKLEGSEKLQVMNYGVGGYYDLHFDAFDVDDVENNEFGNRIATVLFYLSDVEQGGATTFPLIEKTIFPRKGSAVLFYDLNNKMEIHNLTMHAACPVLYGSKWVCNKWIRSKAQIFRKPCYK